MLIVYREMRSFQEVGDNYGGMKFDVLKSQTQDLCNCHNR